MGNGNKLYISLIATLIIGWVGAYFIVAKFHKTYCHNQSVVAASPIKETPDIVMKARLAANTENEARRIRQEIDDKYHFYIYCSYGSTDMQCISFLKQLLVDEEVAKKLAAYKVDLYVSDEFKNVGSSIFIDSKRSPREALEYIQTH